MAVEQYANNASTTLNGATDNSQTSIPVHSVAPFPTIGQFRILVDAEIMLVNSVAGSTFSVTRAVEGTSAAAHGDTATVTHVLTSGGIVGVAGSVALSGNTVNLPVAGVYGRLFLPTDGGYIYQDNGSAWRSLGPIFPMKPVVPSQYSWVNQGSATETSGNGVINLKPISGAGVQGRFKSIGASSGYTAILGFKNFGFAQTGNFGIYLRESSTGKLINFTFDWGGAGSIDVGKYNSPTSFSAGYGPTPTGTFGLVQQPVMWFKVVDNGTNLLFSVAAIGYDYVQVFSVSRTDFLATGADQVGYGCDVGTTNCQLLVYSFDITIP